MVELLPCDYRRRVPDDETHFHCSHPRMCAPKREEVVLVLTCKDCEFAAWSSDLAKAQYFRRRMISPTPEQYAFRVNMCDQCEFRRENYCPKAGGACGLLSSLAKSSFECPEDYFGRINNDRYAETPIEVAAAPAETSEGATAETAADTETEAGDGDGANDATGEAAAQ
jgi:hypothetical protein